MVDAYALVFAGMLFTAGALGDRFGRKEMLQGGLVLFLVGAFVAVVASSPAQVIASRAVMGLAAAFIMPSTPRHPHQHLPDRRAGTGDLDVGRHRGRHRRPRSADVGLPARALLVGIGLPDQCAVRRGGAGPRRPPRALVQGRRGPTPRLRRRRALHGRGRRPHLRHHRSPRARLGQHPHARHLRRGRRAACRLRGPGADSPPPDARPAAVPGPALQRRLGEAWAWRSSPCSGRSSS